jgi:alkaline phosphatase
VSQSDQGNLVAQAEDLGYEYVTNADELSAASGPRVLALFANEEMLQQAPEGEGASYDPAVPLPQMTEEAIEILSRDPDGFFRFVEEGVDEMSHYNNSELTPKTRQDLNASVANDFAESDRETLLAVTADHECGGLTAEATDDPEYPEESSGNEGDENANISVEDGPFPAADSGYDFVMDWTMTGHTGVDVPLTATGPGSEALTGLYENTAVYNVMAKSLGVIGQEPASAATGASATTSATASSAFVVPDTGGVGPGVVVHQR